MEKPVKEPQKMTIRKAIDSVTDLIASLFLPFINLLVSAGILKGIFVILSVTNVIHKGTSTYEIMYSISEAFFYFIPVFLAFTASKRFKVDTFTSVAIACVLLFPNLTTLMTGGKAIDLFGIPVQLVQYQASIIPILLAIFLQKYVEKACKMIPETLRGMLIPPICLLIIVPITLVVFGPIGMVVGNAFANGYKVVYSASPLIAGFLLGAVQQIMVIFGLHWALFPIVLNNIAVRGFDTLIPLFGGAIFAQGGAAFAVALKCKDAKNRSLALSAAATTLLGITEPALFTVNIPLKKPMICACIAGGLGSAVIGGFNVQASSFALPALTTLPVFMAHNFVAYLVGLGVGFAAAFVLTMVFCSANVDELIHKEEKLGEAA